MRQRKIGPAMLALMTTALVIGLVNLPALAEFGFSLVFFLIVAGLAFFVPMSLVSAELATGWPKTGGVYVWVTEAFGQRWGFVAIWLQWLSQVIGFPAGLTFAAATLAYGLGDRGLADDKLYSLLVVLVVFWAGTFINFRGIEASGWMASVGVLLGAIIPGAIIIGLGVAWVVEGRHSDVTFGLSELVPDVTKINNLTFLIAVLLSYAGMEMSATHAQDVENPGRNYPRAIFFTMVLIFLIYTLGALSIAIVVPTSAISLDAGLMQAIDVFFDAFEVGGLVWLIALMVVFGFLGQITMVIGSPAKGLLVAARNGEIPNLFQKVNHRGVPTRLLIVQAVIVSLLASTFVVMPSVSSSFWLLTALTGQVYLIMYLLMFAAAIRLRYSRPATPRAYRVPGGKVGIWVVAGLGFLASAFAIFVGFYPPSQVSTGNELFFEAYLVGGILVTVGAPLLIHQFRRPEWKSAPDTAAESPPAASASGADA
jgi:putative glutamate/gamma-aminobutyrate antiporter